MVVCKDAVVFCLSFFFVTWPEQSERGSCNAIQVKATKQSAKKGGKGDEYVEGCER